MSDKKDREKTALEIADKMNKKLAEKELFIPILDGFKVVQEKQGNIIFVAVNDAHVMEQFLTDGKLEKEEGFAARIDKVIKEMVDYTKTQDFKLDSVNSVYLKTISTDDFKYEIYVQDLVNKEKNNFIRNICAYFIEPRDNNFFQVCVSSGPFLITEEVKPISKVVVLNSDPVLKNMLAMTENIVRNIKYVDGK